MNVILKRTQVVHTPTTTIRELLEGPDGRVSMDRVASVIEARLGGQGTRNMASAVAALVQKGEVARATVDNELVLYRPGSLLPQGSVDHGFRMFRTHQAGYRSTTAGERTKQEDSPKPTQASSERVSRVLLTLQYGSTGSLTITKDEAKDIYAQLHDIFGA